MQVSLSQLERPLGRKFVVTLDPQQYAVAISSRLRDISKSAQIKGFRPGKVPPNIIEQRFGQQVRAEVANDLVRESLGQALGEHSLRPAAPPDVRFVKAPTLAEFEYEAEFDVMPELPSIDPAALSVTRVTSSIGDEDLDRMIETLRMQRRSFSDVERAAQAGDLVAFSMVVTIDGTRYPAEGEERSATVIGSKAVLPEIEAGLVGLSVGDNKTVSVNYPESINDPAVAGKTGEAAITIAKVQEPSLPEVDADFVRSFGVAAGDIDTFRNEVRGNLEREMRAALSTKLRVEVSERLVNAFPEFALPQSMVTGEAEALRANALQQARNQGQKIDVEPPLDGFMDSAKRRVRAGLLYSEIARVNELKLDQRRVREAIQSIASTYEDPIEIVKMYQNDKRLMGALADRVMEEQVAEWVAERAQTTEEAKPFSQLLGS